MEILAPLILVLLAVTGIGHLLWVFFAWIIRSLLGTTPPPIARPFVPIPEVIDRIQISRTQVNRLHMDGLIDADTLAKVLHALDQYEGNSAPWGENNDAVTPPSLKETTYTPLASSIPLIPLEEPVRTGPAAGEEPPVVLPAPPPKVPARSFGNVLAAFMQQSNIRWGELVGGLLIIGGSIALTISFWNEIAQRPVFKFSIFIGVTAVLFGLGLYSEHRWKLPTTSRGMLLIATLLVPLNCLAFAAFSHGTATAPSAILAQAAVLAVFAGLQWLSAKVIAPQWPGLLTGGNVLLSAVLLALRPLMPGHPGSAQVMELSLLPTAIDLVSCALLLKAASRWKRIRAPAAEGIFLLLGVFSFAAFLGMCLLVYDPNSD